MDDDEKQILKLFEDGDRALIAANVDEVSRIFADDYLQYDQSGKSFSRQDVIDNLKSGVIRYLSMISTGRRIRLLSSGFAIVHGSEEDEVDRDRMSPPLSQVHEVVADVEGQEQHAARSKDPRRPRAGGCG